ncbi:MAG TPA: ECF transporter S component [Clostridia bacterium]|nr:ECF transporter S component [Clostridia bacterium]
MELGKKPAFSYHLNVRQIAVIGMLSSISIVLGLTGYGFIPLPIAKATIMHIPVIIGAILEGPVVGMSIGLIFGLFSIFQSLSSPTLLSFAFINPLVSVLPRVLIGLTSYYCYKLAANRMKTVGIGLGAAVGSLTNTFGVLGMIYLLYAARFAEVNGISAATSAKVIFGIALTNGLPEAVVAVIITVPVILAVMKRK